MSLGTRDRPLGRLQVLVDGGPRLQISETRLVVSEAGEIAVLWVERRARDPRQGPWTTLLRAAIKPQGGGLAGR